MGDHLSRFPPGRAEKKTVNHVVEPPFKLLDENFARNTPFLGSSLKKYTELAFPKTVNSLHLLLFTQLHAVIRKFRTLRAVLAGGIGKPFIVFFIRRAAALQTKIDSFATVKLDNWTAVPAHA